MDKFSWHHWCTSTPTPAPQAWTAHEIRTAPDEALESHARAVGFHLRADPVESPLHAELGEEIAATIAQIQNEPPGARSLLAVSGPFASGKSTLIKETAKQVYLDTIPNITTELPTWISPRIPDVDSYHVPVVYLNLQSDTTGKDLYAQILTFFGREVKATKVVLASETSKATKLHGVRLIVLDDAHMLRTHLATGRATLDTIKAIATELGEEGGHLLLVGAWDNHSDLLDDPQIRARLKTHTVTTYGVDDAFQRAQWQQLLYEWERRLRIFLPDLANGAIKNRLAGKLFQKTQGYAGDLATCLSTATRQSLSNRSTTLEPELLNDPDVSHRALDQIARDKRSNQLKSTG